MVSRITEPLIVGGVIGDVLDVFTPTLKLNVIYNSNNHIRNGLEIMPSAVMAPPQVQLMGGDLHTFFTLIMTDPDAPSPSDPTGREYLHWMVTDIPGSKSNSFGCEMVGYENPRPMVGIHRYVFVLFKQNRKGSVEPPPSRCHFNTRQFAERNGLGLPVAAVYFNAQRETAYRRR
ncbi:hypothetical protein SUGI_1201410 [Cryptomeria japonica]|uniref:CEN-like protein 1 n=1 Tax=Cryptomeria japonica TaxID=3369 RepID=UPI002414A7E7|nr:CEN-like protein 1 [Cryptomeria japonica]GLJ55965.1 hypothetical protein SUGI_1201410 [Cryptomeria japonica]